MTTQRITWQNVAAPEFGAAGLLMGSASQLVGKAFDGFNSLMSDRAKQQADNLTKTQDYWTKMAGIPIQRLGVDEATALSVLDPMMALSKLGGLPTDDKSVFDIPAIAGLLAARVPKAREEASANIDWQNKQAGIAEAPLLTVATETMLKDPARAFTNMSALLNTPEMAGLRPATRSQLLKDAYSTTASAKQAALTNREKQLSIDSAVAAQRDKDQAAKLKHADEFVRATTSSRSNGLLEFDEKGELRAPVNTLSLFNKLQAEQGESSNIGNTPFSWADFFSSTDNNTVAGAAKLDTEVPINYADASGKKQTFLAHIPTRTKMDMVTKHASLGDEEDFEEEAVKLVDGVNAVFSLSSDDPIAELKKAGYTPGEIAKITENATAMLEEAAFRSNRQAVKSAALSGSSLESALLRMYAEQEGQRQAAIKAAKEARKNNPKSPGANANTLLGPTGGNRALYGLP